MSRHMSQLDDMSWKDMDSKPSAGVTGGTYIWPGAKLFGDDAGCDSRNQLVKVLLQEQSLVL